MKCAMSLMAGLVSATTALGSSLERKAPDPTSLEAFVAIPRPQPDVELSYGPAHEQGIDVFRPRGEGPFPVAILIHGGCWRRLPGAGREQLRHIGPKLANRGIAVWSIGYRRADEDGGGYPGTFQDVGEAIDRLRSDAARYHLDLVRTVVVGHSAGGHLALWAAARDRLSSASPLHRDEPLMPGAVISLGGVGDLEAFSRFVPVLCGPGILDTLAPTADAYAEISPAALAPPKAPITMISGILDHLVPPYVAHDYARAMRRKQGPAIDLVDVPGAGHFDLVTPGTTAWDEVILRITAALGIHERDPAQK